MDNVQTPDENARSQPQPEARGLLHSEHEVGSEPVAAPVEVETGTEVLVGGQPIVALEFAPEGDVKTEAEVLKEEVEANPPKREGADLPVEAESGEPLQGAPNKGQDEEKWAGQADDERTYVDDQGVVSTGPGDAGADSFGTTGGTTV